MESDDFLDGKSVASSTGKELANSAKKQKRRNSASSVNSISSSGLQIASAIRDTYNANAPSEAQYMQQRVSFMMAEEERRKGEEIRKNNEEERRGKEDARKDNEEIRRAKEDQRNDRKQQLDEWERIRLVIRGINEDLKNPLLDEDEKNDLLEERQGLKKRKLAISQSLGLM